MTKNIEETEKSEVIKALENPKYKWRTVRGVAKETGLAEEVVRRIIERCRDQITKSSVPSPDGDDLFTTRSNYLAKATFYERFGSAIRNRLG